MIPERSIIGKSAKSVFFEEVNDIDIYIEDTTSGYDKLYRIIFSRIFKGKYNVGKVFPLGGRNAVLDRYKNQNDTDRPFLFVIDGDLYLTTGDEIGSCEGLFVLPCYCIENILCDSNAFIEIMDDEDIEKDKETLFQLFNFTDWEINNKNKLFDLFVLYALIFKILPEIQTVAYSVKKLVSSRDGVIDQGKFKSRIAGLRGKLEARIGKEGVDKEIDKLGKKSYW